MKTYKLKKSNIKFRTYRKDLNYLQKKYKQYNQNQFPLNNKTRKKKLIGSSYLTKLGISGFLISSFYLLNQSKIDDNTIKDEEYNFLDELNKFSGISNILKDIINGFNINLVQTKKNKIKQLEEESSNLDVKIENLQEQVNEFTGILEKCIFLGKGFFKIITGSTLMTKISHKLDLKTCEAQKLIKLKKEAEDIQNRINELNSSNFQVIKEQVASFYHQIQENLPSFYKMITTGVSELPMNYLIRYDEDGDISVKKCSCIGSNKQDEDINNYFNRIPTLSKKWHQKLISVEDETDQWIDLSEISDDDKKKPNKDDKEAKFVKKLYDITSYIKDPSSINLPLNKNYTIYRVGVYSKTDKGDLTFILKDKECLHIGEEKTPKECENNTDSINEQKVIEFDKIWKRYRQQISKIADDYKMLELQLEEKIHRLINGRTAIVYKIYYLIHDPVQNNSLQGKYEQHNADDLYDIYKESAVKIYNLCDGLFKNVGDNVYFDENEYQDFLKDIKTGTGSIDMERKKFEENIQNYNNYIVRARNILVEYDNLINRVIISIKDTINKSNIFAQQPVRQQQPRQPRNQPPGNQQPRQPGNQPPGNQPQAQQPSGQQPPGLGRGNQPPGKGRGRGRGNQPPGRGRGQQGNQPPPSQPSIQNGTSLPPLNWGQGNTHNWADSDDSD